MLKVFLFVLLICSVYAQAQDFKSSEQYLRIAAEAQDPLYTTYAAAMSRSRLYGDKAYKMDYYSGCRPINYSADQAGSMSCLWKVDQVLITGTEQFHRRPVVIFSFPDMAIMEYEPVRGLQVRETFFVYSSSVALVDMEIRNTGNITREVTLYPMLEVGNDSLEVDRWDERSKQILTLRNEWHFRLISSLKREYPYPIRVRDLFTCWPDPVSYGAYHGGADALYTALKTDYYAPVRTDILNGVSSGLHDFIVLQFNKRLKPLETLKFRYIRGCQGAQEDLGRMVLLTDSLKRMLLKTYYEDNLILMSKIPRLRFKNNGQKMAYIGAFNLARGCMLPASGETQNNYYVFSRNPLWGWGHGHQVLHESLSMLAYAYLDPVSAAGSQRVYMEQQREDGLIAYRHGPRGLQDYPHKGMPTTSAPFFNWINLEVYEAGKERKFLEAAYESGSRYAEWMIRNRDTDQDGTFEWGPYGLIENVRDWYNAVFQVSAERYLEVDKEDISDELECLDLTLMMIKEERSLARMATLLGKTSESKRWHDLAEATSRLVNERMWDEESGFYYSVDKKSHTFQFMTRDLRRQEIIGFLALWAEVAPKERAERLVKTLTDTTRFWRRYGVPSLSAADPFYNPNVDYCCKWNGPVWMPWNYMVYRGLRSYGYNDIASRLAEKMMAGALLQLSRNHQYWESYSPDNEVLNCPSNYIWDAIVARLLIDENRTPVKVTP